ncbi:cupin domain-containing protein [Rubellicoccus peritrichatus]|uniref:Cupin domain-containing protein n=1 Tax=Rubellicoccus peritrichatus TaxID=3080537 RepID=A0AAQ3QVA2_9BACT|nr:cupin domain-containing protein [Puniceicoccus sp. CR14]WOO41358.1 cupin domain-containing protein [Puniceicoccus sp. CR14]
MADLQLSHASTSLIGGLGMTRVTVYDQRVAPDGKHSGCPHLHAICAEAYYVLSGKGYVELHNLEDGWHEVKLQKGTYFQFPPNTLHRLVNEDQLVILGMMSNAGLAENGDARIYFGPEVDSDPFAYEDSVALVSKGLEGALERRDRAVEGYQHLIELWDSDRDTYFDELKRFINRHREFVSMQHDKFASYIANGPRAWADRAETLLSDCGHTDTGSKTIQHTPTESARFGMCGTLHPVQANGESTDIGY